MIKVGLIGCGFMGTMHANCYKNIEGVELAAVADLRREKAEEVAQGTNATIYSDGKDLIANADLDIIDICLPTFLHAEYALMAMDKVGYLFVEKPVTLTTEEGDALLAKSKATGCKVQVGQVVRFMDEYVELKKIVESGKYGKVVNANFRRISPRPEWGWKSWLLDCSLSGGAAQDLHVHDIDYVLSIFGEPENFYTLKNIIGEKNSYINTIMKYPEFVVGLEGTWDLPASYAFNAMFRVVFENAVVENAGGKFVVYDKNGVHDIALEKKEIKGGGYSGGNISDLGGYYNELVSFCNAASRGADIEDATLYDGVASLKFLLKELEFNA